MQYLSKARRHTNPVTQPLDPSMIKNHAGGYSYEIDDYTRLMRFLILGAATSTYYVSQKKLVKENLDVVERILANNMGRDIVTTILEISQAGRAASNDPALFALARCG